MLAARSVYPAPIMRCSGGRHLSGALSFGGPGTTTLTDQLPTTEAIPMGTSTPPTTAQGSSGTTARDALAGELQRLAENKDAFTPYEELSRLRRAAFREHVAALDTDGRMAAWALRMVQAYGSDRATAWQNVVSWPVAFMVAKYGEDVTHWPATLTEVDEARMAQWLASPRELGRGIVPLNMRMQSLPAETLQGLNESAT